MGPFRPMPNGIKKSSISVTRSPKKRKQRQTDAKASKEWVHPTFHGKPPRRAQKATSKLKTLAGRPVREGTRKRPPLQRSPYQEAFELYQRVIDQQRFDQNKVVAIHKPFTACIAKGKAHQIDELGNQVGLIATGGPTMIITAIGAFEGNPHDSKTSQPLWEQHESIVGLAPKEWVVDRGGRGKRPMGHTKRLILGKPLKNHTPYQKQKKRKKCRRLTAMEPLMGHLKTEHRLQENDLMGAHRQRSMPLWQLRGGIERNSWNSESRMFFFTFSEGLHCQLKELRSSKE